MNYLRYAGIVIAVTLGLPIVLGLIAQVTGINLGSAFVVIAPAMAAAMIEGQKFVSKTLRLPTGKETGAFVIFATLILVGFQALLTAAVITNVPAYETLLISPPSIWLIIGVVAFVTVAVALCNWSFLRMGAKNQIKVLQRAGQSK